MSAADIISGLTDAMDNDLAGATYSASINRNDGAYNTATGLITGATTITGRGIPYDYQVSEIDGSNIRQDDRKFVFLTSEFASVPEIDELITLTDPTAVFVDQYKIVNVNIHPFDASGELQLRKS